jgi:elongation factor Ts
VSITATDIKQLREATGAGVLDCKKALQETEGNFDQAVEFLRKKGLAAASKKASREANDGLISARVSAQGQVGAIVEVNCETDFVARTEDFQNFVDVVVRQVLQQPHVDNAETLLAAPSLDDQTKTVAEQVTAMIAKLGENIMIRRVTRFVLDGDGMIDSYIHPGGRVGVLVEVAGGSPNNKQFVDLVHDLALQIAAASPRYVNEQDVSVEAVESEKNIYRSQVAEDKKPDNVKERIIEGKLKKWYSEVVLLNQEFVKDTDLTIAKLLQQRSQELGKEIKVRRFARFELGTE